MAVTGTSRTTGRACPVAAPVPEGEANLFLRAVRRVVRHRWEAVAVLGFMAATVMLAWAGDAWAHLARAVRGAPGVVGDLVIAFALVWLPIAVIDARRCTRETALRARVEADLEAQLAVQREEDALRALVAARVRTVLHDGGPTVVYQPIVEMATREVVGFEALSRFPDAAPPNEWFDHAARFGLGWELERAALCRAIAGLAALPGNVFLSINTSPGLLSNPEVVGVLCGPWAKRLVVELTEHMVVDNYYRFREVFEQMRRCGVRLAVDDAGAGYASFRHIVDLSPDIIKVDGSLVRGVDSDPARRSLMGAFVTFSSDIGATLVAECVETEEEAAELRRWGIRLAQGWLYGKPASLEALTGAVPAGGGPDERPETTSLSSVRASPVPAR